MDPFTLGYVMGSLFTALGAVAGYLSVRKAKK